jgi:hypothetical protein
MYIAKWISVILYPVIERSINCQHFSLGQATSRAKEFLVINAAVNRLIRMMTSLSKPNDHWESY